MAFFDHQNPSLFLFFLNLVLYFQENLFKAEKNQSLILELLKLYSSLVDERLRRLLVRLRMI
ncbi:hypothetical protein ES319_D04G131100v1 [Gossypium barbadense]|uniref:Uncharacterized protein n=2 Tax=Gossypium TaxID=3633 RepID=A0A5J5RVT5_GOSBA|nr:hypothetical protein ES319_D04G131100v1 [Gossypium barbadense]